MKIVCAMLDRPRRYSITDDDWEFSNEEDNCVREGELLEGHVEFSEPGKTPPTEVSWIDSFGRKVKTVPARYNAQKGHAYFKFTVEGHLTRVNHLICVAGGTGEPATIRFTIIPTKRDWDHYPVFTWSNYPAPYFDDLRRLGITGTIAYKEQPIDNIEASNFDLYAEQLSPYEVSVYHRPFDLNVEDPIEPTREKFKYGFLLTWDGVRQRYMRAREKAGESSIASDPHLRKALWRHFCLNNPDTWTKAEALMEHMVKLHKPRRPVYYSIADEPGITDQAAPMDFCFCSHCLSKMRGWLEQEYTTLKELNNQWGTSFTRWSDVIPETTDDVIRRQREKRDFNFSSWNDHREFMNDTFAEAFARLQAVGKKVDPYGYFALEGGQPPSVFGGYDYAKLVPAVEVHEIYNIGCNDEIVRSFANDRTVKLTCFFGSDKLITSFMWYQLLHGDKAQIHWDFDQKGKKTFIEKPSRRQTIKAKNFAPTMRELTRGAAEQIYQCKRVSEQVAIHYSQPSINANWIIDVMEEGEDWVMRDSEHETSRNPNLRVRYGWVKLIEDIGHQHRFVSGDMLAKDVLIEENFKVLILPQSLAISDVEADAIKRFVRNGGTVIADNRPGIMDGHCRRTKNGLLDDLFGTKRKEIDFTYTGPVVDKVKLTDIFGLDALELPVAELGVTAVSAKIGGTAASKPCLYVNKYGAGTAVNLNINLEPYINYRRLPGSAGETTPQRLLAKLFEHAGISPEATVRTKAQRHPPGWELIPFEMGDARLTALVLNELRRYGGIGEQLDTDNPFAGRHQIEVEVKNPGHVYDGRKGTYFGFTDTARLSIHHLEPALLWSLPYRVDGLEIQINQSGNKIVIRARLKAARKSRFENHVIRFDVYDPDGSHVHYYSVNKAALDGIAEHIYFPAEDEKAGQWKVVAKDMVTATSAEGHYSI